MQKKINEKDLEDTVHILKEENLVRLERELQCKFMEGYSVCGGISVLNIGDKTWYCVIVSKPF